MNLDFTEQETAKQVYKTWARTYGSGSSNLATVFADLLGDPSDRRTSDALAAWLRWHDPGVANELSGSARYWYQIFEKARVEVIASRHLPGIQRNLLVARKLPMEGGLEYLVYWVCRQLLEGADEPAFDWLNKQFAAYDSRKHGLGALKFFSIGPKREVLDARQFLYQIKQSINFVGSPALYFSSVKPLINQLSRMSPEGENLISDSSAVLDLPHGDDGSFMDHGKALQSDAEQPDGNYRTSVSRDFPRYRVFSCDWDEMRPAVHWLTPEDRMAMSLLLTPDRIGIRRLAHRFQRRLEASLLRHWNFDFDEGLIDSRRLARLVGERPNPRVFRKESQAEAPESFVTFLVDQSGSMRGERQRMAAMTIDLAVHTLEGCGVACEVLGYTTRGMIDNPVSRLWGRLGQPTNPGRLNALRHIIYKSENQPWHLSRGSLGLMLRKGFGSENVDGEALVWVSRRLSNRCAPRKVIIIVSDGAPYDEATARVHGRTYLEEHLRRVIDRISKAGIYLLAVGPDAEINRFYSNALVVRDPTSLPQQIFAALEQILIGQFSRSSQR